MFFLYFNGSQLSAQGVRYVSTTGNDNNAGTSWASAFRTVQRALQVATDGQQIWVARGAYYPDEGGASINNDRMASFVLRNNIALFGGFLGTETALTQRNWNQNVTILSGDIDQNDQPNFVNNSNNSYHVLQNQQNVLNATAVLDGFTVQGGNANLSNGKNNLGGGLYIQDGSPTIRNCRFIANAALGNGGAINFIKSTSQITDCVFVGNRAAAGGAIHNLNASPIITRCYFEANVTTNQGGAIYNQIESDIRVLNSIFLRNSASTGGAMVNDAFSFVSITNCIFLQNTSSTLAGAVLNIQGAKGTLINCSFWGNSAPQGGTSVTNGVNGRLDATNCIFWGSTSEIVTDASSRDSITYSIVQRLSGLPVYPGLGNLNSDPFYRNAANGDLRLSTSSPALNAGNNTANTEPFDLDGNIRVQGIIDLGAYEKQFDCPTSGILYVNRNANGLNNGRTWLNAYRTLQDALADNCPAITQIWVAAGTYYPDEGGGNTDNDRNAAFEMRQGVAIYGGFSGIETNLNQRNLRSNITILSGDIDQNDDPSLDYRNLFSHPSIAGNSNNVVRNIFTEARPLTNTARLDGFTIVGGNANMTGSTRGGGMLNSYASPTIVNCIFLRNVASRGGAMENVRSSPTIVNSLFYHNHVDGGGGAISNFINSSPVLTNCTITENLSRRGTTLIAGGAMRNNTSCFPQIINSIIWRNEFNQFSASSGIEDGFESTTTITFSIVETGFTGQGNLSSNPQLEIANTFPGNFRLRSNSPAINSGNSVANDERIDLDGNPRKLCQIDRGCYEFPITVPTVLYVNQGISSPGNGSSWASAYRSLQNALEDATNCPTIQEIWVAGGTYYPDEGRLQTNNSAQHFFALRDSLRIFGSFIGNETELSQRSLTHGITSILSGEIQQDGNRNNNSRVVVVGENLTSRATLDGFVIEEGNAPTLLPEEAGRGAGMQIINSTNPLLSNLIIRNNTAAYGAALTNVSSRPIIRNCLITGNRTLSSNGVVYNINSNPIFAFITIANNVLGADSSVLRNTGTAAPTIISSIIRGTSTAIAGGTPNISFSIIQHPTVWPGNSNSNADPLFVNEAGGNLRLRHCSPAINSASASFSLPFDIEGNSRTADVAPDRGAFEYNKPANRLYVNAAAAPGGDGSSWASALRSLQDALTVNYCPAIWEIWVAQGTYRPTTDTNRDSAFVMRNGLAIYGGFAGTETQLSQRNWRLNPTILSGDIGVAGNRSDNSHNVISNNNNGLNATAILDGFIIRDGQYDKSGSTKKGGGGMLNVNSSPWVSNCIFVSNFSTSDGGAVFNQGASATPTFINCVFSGNQAVFGGGIYNAVARTQVINCTFSSNQAAAGAGMFSTGIPSGNPRASVRNSIVWGNTDGILNASYVLQSSHIEVSNSIVQGGYSGTGNLNANPLFLAPAPIGLGQLGNLRILGCSPAYNAGQNAALPTGISTDLAGFPRVFVGVDMGAYERQNPGIVTFIRLDATATGTGEGTSWANAHTSLEAALNDLNLCNAANPPTLTIAKGTYIASAQAALIIDKLNGNIVGGFPNGGGARNAATNPVIIRGGTVRVLKSVTMDGVRVQQ